MIAALLPFLGGPLGKVVVYGALAAALLAGGWAVVHEHDRRILAERAAIEAAAVAVQQVAEARNNAAALAAERDAAIARERAASTIKQEIARAPVTTACAASPAVSAALDGLRRTSRPGGGAAGSPSGAAGVPGAAGAARSWH